MEKFDKQWIGIILGLIFPIIGLIVYHKIGAFKMDFFEFLKQSRIIGVTSKILSLGLLANLIIFLITINLKLDRTSRGIIISTFIYAAIILGFKFLG